MAQVIKNENRVFSVKTVCYKNERFWDDRNDAINFFQDCVYNSEGAEQNRYLTILSQLMTGAIIATDGSDRI